jgi:hypothetical protein
MLSVTFLSGEAAGTSDDQELNFELAVGMACLATNSVDFLHPEGLERENRRHSLNECRRFPTRLFK